MSQINNQLNVFTCIRNSPIVSDELSLSSFWRIVNGFKTESGKQLGPRVVRSSRITNSRSLNLSFQQQSDMADAMSHTIATANRNYNNKSICDSVVQSLAAKENAKVASISYDSSDTACLTIATENRKDHNESLCDSVVQSVASKGKAQIASTSFDFTDSTLLCLPQSTSTPVKSGSFDETLLNLRSKKIKASVATSYKELKTIEDFI